MPEPDLPQINPHSKNGCPNRKLKKSRVRTAGAQSG